MPFLQLYFHLYLDNCARTSSIEVASSANTIMFPPLVTWLYLLNALASESPALPLRSIVAAAAGTLIVPLVSAVVDSGMMLLLGAGGAMAAVFTMGVAEAVVDIAGV